MSDPAVTLTVETDGSVSFPPELCQRLGLEPGSRVVVRIRDDGHAELITAAALAEELRGLMAASDGRSLSEELVRERREQADRE